MKKLWPSEVSENSKQLAGNLKFKLKVQKWAGREIFPPRQVDYSVDLGLAARVSG